MWHVIKGYRVAAVIAADELQVGPYVSGICYLLPPKLKRHHWWNSFRRMTCVCSPLQGFVVGFTWLAQCGLTGSKLDEVPIYYQETLGESELRE